jgi:hypothetical protein
MRCEYGAAQVNLRRGELMRRVLIALAFFAVAGVAQATSTCWITEFAQQSSPIYPAALQPPLAEQTITASGSSTASSAFQSNTVLVRITCNVSVSIEFGASPSATAAKALLPSGAIEYYSVPPYQSYKVAVITSS